MVPQVLCGDGREGRSEGNKVSKDTERVGTEDGASLKDRYYQWCQAEAYKIGSDGCTLVSEWNQPCCYEHDLGCHYLRDPRKAFEFYLYGLKDYWAISPQISRREADKRFATCNLSRSSVKRPWEFARSVVRFVGVRLGSFWPF